jgi:hypothetical protein
LWEVSILIRLLSLLFYYSGMAGLSSGKKVCIFWKTLIFAMASLRRLPVVAYIFHHLMVDMRNSEEGVMWGC